MIPLNFHHLYYFYKIAEKGTVSEAAKDLRLSQPALSFQLKQLENFLGMKLFKREGRRLVLSEEGRMTLAYARQIFDAGNEFLDSLHDRSSKGRIRIQLGISNSVPKVFANALLQFILKIAPSAFISVLEDTLERMAAALDEHRLDLLLTDSTFGHGVREDMENHLAGKVPVLFFTHRSLAKKYAALPQGLEDAPVILPTSDSRIYHAVQEYFQENKVRPRIIAEIQDIELVRLMVAEKAGIAPLPGFHTVHSSLFQNLVPLPQKAVSVFQTLYLIAKKRRMPHPMAERILREFRVQAGV